MVEVGSSNLLSPTIFYCNPLESLMSINVPVVVLPHGQDLPLPSYATLESAGMDLFAAIDADMVLAPGARNLVAAGISIALPFGYEAQVRPRSGLAFKNGITVLNTPGTIDADYRGEIKVILINHGQEAFTITRGMRIAQMVIAPVLQATLVPSTTLPESGRGEGGFGSTGH
jgi:dUTP pyrophosphatase